RTGYAESSGDDGSFHSRFRKRPAGRRVPSGTPGAFELRFAFDGDLRLFLLGRSLARHEHLEHAGVEIGLYLVGIDVEGKREAAKQSPVRAFDDMIVLLL